MSRTQELSGTPSITSFAGEYEFLSNFAWSPFDVPWRVDRQRETVGEPSAEYIYGYAEMVTVCYATVEHWFQAMKARSWSEHERIRLMETPGRPSALAVERRSDRTGKT